MDSNDHLNLFKFFSENTDSQFIENNLSRALALCLKYDVIFLEKFIEAIAESEDSNYLLADKLKNSFDLNIQVRMNTVEIESFKKVYAIAITGDASLNMSDFLTQEVMEDRDHHITDIWISLKDIAFVIEVKTTLEDCKRQLYNQVLPFLQKSIGVVVKSFPWQEIIKIMEDLVAIERHELDSLFIKDFLHLSEARYPEWFMPKPFNQLRFSSHPNTIEYHNLMKRMSQCVSAVKAYPRLGYSRMGLKLPCAWATELIPWFVGENKEEQVAFTVWPGNTKAQGENIYKRSLDWADRTSLRIDGREYKLTIGYNIKFAHFNRSLANVFFRKDREHVISIPHTPENFENFSGRWNRSDWPQVEQFLDRHFAPDFKWRHIVNWDENFTYTERNYLTLSLGFEVTLYVPFKDFKEIDKIQGDVTNISNFITRVADAYAELIEPR